MLVEDNPEPCLLRFANDVVELGQPDGIEPVLRIHVAERVKGHADEIEAGFADLGEVAPLEAPLARIIPIRVVAENVDPALERLVRGVKRDRRRSGRNRRGSNADKRNQQRTNRVKNPHSGSLLILRLVK